MRTATRRAAVELVLLYATAEDQLGCRGPVDDLCARLSARQPKVVAANVNALAALVRAFGGEQVDTTHVAACLPTVFAHADKNVRAEGTQLALELHRAGAVLDGALGQMKEIQAKELRETFAQAAPAGAPERYLLSMQGRVTGAAAEEPAAKASADDLAKAPAVGADEPAAAPVDPYEAATPVNALQSPKLTPQFFELVQSAKWKERMEALESLYAALTESVRLVDDPGYSAYVQELQLRVQKDATLHVVLQACRCLGALARGLRTSMQPYLYVLPTLLEKLKERKPMAVEVISDALDAFFACGRLSHVLEPIAAHATHKNPAVKTGTLRFLVRCLQSTPTPPSGAELKSAAEILVAALPDGSADVRNAAAAGLGTLVRLVGEAAMAPYLRDLDAIKQGKVMEEARSAVVSVHDSGSASRGSEAAGRAAPKPKAPPASAAARPRPADAAAGARAAAPAGARAPPVTGRPPAASPRRPPVRTAAPGAPDTRPKPRAAKLAVRSATDTSAMAGGAATAAATEPVRYTTTPEDAEGRAAELLPEDVRTQLASKSWQERRAGAQALVDWVQVAQPDAELVARFLSKTPGWKESNFQVNGEVFRAMQVLAREAPSFGRAAAALTIPPLCEKLGDLKLKATAGETLLQYADATSFGFVLAQAVPSISALRAPKAQADALLWVDQALLAFGAAGVDVRGLVEYLVASLKSANAAVRTAATTVFTTLARYTGSVVLGMVSDVTPQLRAELESKIAAAEPPPAPTRGGDTSGQRGAKRADKAPADVEAPAATDAAPGVDEAALEALVPRVDIDALVPAAALRDADHAEWKVRKASLENILGALEGHERFKGSAIELANTLRPRFADANIMVRTLALQITQRAANGLNAGAEPMARVLAGPVAQVLADSKAPLRASASAALTALATQVGVGVLVPSLGAVLDGKGANPTLRQDLFAWLVAQLEARPPHGTDLSSLVPSVVASLDDRAAPVRKSAQALLKYLVASVGHAALVAQTNTLKDASKATALPLIDGARADAAGLKQAGAPGRSMAPPAASAPKRSAMSTRPTSVKRPTAAPAVATSRPAGMPSASAAAARSEAAPGAGARTTPTRTPRQPTAVSRPLAKRAADESAADGAATAAPLLHADPKYKAVRERHARGPWMIDGVVRSEQAELLRQQMETCIAPGLVRLLLSQDHNAERDYIDGLAQLYALVAARGDSVPLVVANSDVLIRYACVRLLDKNTSVALRCFELLAALVDELSAAGVQLGENEAQALLTSLIVRLGDAKSAFRDQARDILRRTTLVFPPSRLFAVLLEHGPASKNARTRTEALNELAYLLSLSLIHI